MKTRQKISGSSLILMIVAIFIALIIFASKNMKLTTDSVVIFAFFTRSVVI